MAADYEQRFGGLARLYGRSGMERLRAAHVCVVGVGGVGSWTVEALARSGIGALTLIDLDDICVTNVNRQLPALDGAIGRPKIDVLAERVKRIQPECRIECIPQFMTTSTVAELLAPKFDFVVDAIDKLSNKCHLIVGCHERGLPVLTIGGAGGKRDGTAVRVRDLAHTEQDELLRQVRRKLRREYAFTVGTHSAPPSAQQPFGIPAVFSPEKPVFPWSDGSCSVEPEPGGSLTLDCASGFGTATHVTGAFGFAAAGEVIRRLVAALFILLTLSAGAQPVKLIFDTDMDSDCDDVGALAMVHALADRGEVEILGTLVSSKHPWSAACTDAVNTFYGRPDLPVGVPKGKGPSEQNSKYAKQIAEEFPHDMPAGDAVPDACVLYRRILAAQPDASVSLVTVGDLTNVRYLLESAPDAASPLSGRDLVARKVARWVCMGSRYPADLDPARWGNFKPDPDSTVRAVEGWPGSIVFTGGGAFAEKLATGSRLSELPAKHPLRRAYELYFGGSVKSRHSADQIAVFVAARGTGAPWKLVSEGHNFIFPDGRHEWRAGDGGVRHSYISALGDGEDAKRVATQIVDLMLHKPR
jgi:tRNA A37 threonylcarbamoyladenosine dehydratase